MDWNVYGDFRLKSDSPIDPSTVGLPDSFPARFNEIVRADLGDAYRDFATLESLCRPVAE